MSSKSSGFYTAVLLLSIPSIVLGLLATTPVASFFAFSFVRAAYSSTLALSPASIGVALLGVDVATIVGLMETIVSAGLLAVAVWELRR